MNITALCALLGLGCAAPAPRPHVEILGMVAGQAREIMQRDWDAQAQNPTAPERMYEVMRDSASAWLSGPNGQDTLIVLFVLEVRPVPAKFAYVLGISPMYVPVNPTIHTHFAYCDMTPWGPDRQSCSTSRPETHQCQPSAQDRRTQEYEGHPYDVVQCDRNAWVFYYNPELR